MTGIGGVAASTPLFSIPDDVALGEWVHLAVKVDFVHNEVKASYNGKSYVTLPIALSPTAEKGTFRLCFRGEGTDNVSQVLLDDVFVEGNVSTAPMSVPSGAPAASLSGLIVLIIAMVCIGIWIFRGSVGDSKYSRH